jgi:GNAT superfamily N-acetyltransferase
MEASLDELAEHTEVHLLPRPTFESVEGDGFVYLAGLNGANVHPYRVDDVAAAVEWCRAESRRRGQREVEWWVGWRAEPPGLGARLVEAGLTRSEDPPTLTGMTCIAEPPPAPAVDVRRVETREEYMEAVQVDWEVWQLDDEERARRRVVDFDRYEEIAAAGVVHHFSAFLDGRRAGFGRAIDMATGVALFGGAVLPGARRRGVYRALVHARWQHAAERGTPLLVVQAGPMSAPALDGLGFRRHGDVELYCDGL